MVHFSGWFRYDYFCATDSGTTWIASLLFARVSGWVFWNRDFALEFLIDTRGLDLASFVCSIYVFLHGIPNSLWDAFLNNIISDTCAFAFKNTPSPSVFDIFALFDPYIQNDEVARVLRKHEIQLNNFRAKNRLL